VQRRARGAFVLTQGTLLADLRPIAIGLKFPPSQTEPALAPVP